MQVYGLESLETTGEFCAAEDLSNQPMKLGIMWGYGSQREPATARPEGFERLKRINGSSKRICMVHQIHGDPFRTTKAMSGTEKH